MEFFLRPGIVPTIVENCCIVFPVLRLFYRIDASVQTVFMHEVVIREVVTRRWRNTWIGEISIGIIGRGLDPHYSKSVDENSGHRSNRHTMQTPIPQHNRLPPKTGSPDTVHTKSSPPSARSMHPIYCNPAADVRALHEGTPLRDAPVQAGLSASSLPSYRSRARTRHRPP
jgi:hypothetical protein